MVGEDTLPPEGDARSGRTTPSLPLCVPGADRRLSVPQPLSHIRLGPPPSVRPHSRMDEGPPGDAPPGHADPQPSSDDAVPTPAPEPGNAAEAVAAAGALQEEPPIEGWGCDAGFAQILMHCLLPAVLLLAAYVHLDVLSLAYLGLFVAHLLLPLTPHKHRLLASVSLGVAVMATLMQVCGRGRGEGRVDWADVCGRAVPPCPCLREQGSEGSLLGGGRVAQGLGI